MLRNYALFFSQRGTQPGLLRHYAVDARAICACRFDARFLLFAGRSFDVASFARNSQPRFFDDLRECVQLGIPIAS